MVEVVDVAAGVDVSVGTVEVVSGSVVVVVATVGQVETGSEQFVGVFEPGAGLGGLVVLGRRHDAW